MKKLRTFAPQAKMEGYTWN